MVYTGYRLDALRGNAARFGKLLAEVDFLIDGEYRQDLPGPFRWRGSQNQAIYDLRRNERLDGPDECGSREIQLTLGPEGLRLTGFPSSTTMRQLADSLERRGVHMAPVRGGGSV